MVRGALLASLHGLVGYSCRPCLQLLPCISRAPLSPFVGIPMAYTVASCWVHVLPNSHSQSLDARCMHRNTYCVPNVLLCLESDTHPTTQHFCEDTKIAFKTPQNHQNHFLQPLGIRSGYENTRSVLCFTGSCAWDP